VEATQAARFDYGGTVGCIVGARFAAALARDGRTPIDAQAEWAQANDLFHTEIHVAADNKSLAKSIAYATFQALP
jgi:DNA-binding GntR family transcriptional regulator